MKRIKSLRTNIAIGVGMTVCLLLWIYLYHNWHYPQYIVPSSTSTNQKLFIQDTFLQMDATHYEKTIEPTTINGVKYDKHGQVVLSEKLTSKPPTKLSANESSSSEYWDKIKYLYKDVQIEIPWCPILTEHYKRYQLIQNSETTYFIALNLYNSEAVLPNMGLQLLSLAELLGPHRLFVSIYENGSQDRTPEALAILREKLTKAGVKNDIKSIKGEAIDWDSVNRIATLANLRNLAIEPMIQQKDKDGKTYDQLIFINDVFFCVTDVLELLRNQYVQSSDITCGLDFVWSDWMQELIFYDSWVARDMSGSRFWNSVKVWQYEMLSNDTDARIRWEAGLPFQAWSCWNGLVVIDPEPIYNGIRFRRSDVSQQECAASECTLIAKDYWNLGYGRVMIVPSVKILYYAPAFEKAHSEYPPFSEIIPFADSARKLPRGQNWVQKTWKYSDRDSIINWRKGPVNVICLPVDGDGSHFADELHPVWEMYKNRSAALKRPNRLESL